MISKSVTPKRKPAQAFADKLEAKSESEILDLIRRGQQDVFCHLSIERRANFELALSAISKSPDIFSFASLRLRRSKKFFFALLDELANETYPDDVLEVFAEGIPKEILGNKDCCLKVLETPSIYPLLFVRFSDEMLADKDIARTAIKVDASELFGRLHHSIEGYLELACFAVSKDVNCFRHAWRSINPSKKDVFLTKIYKNSVIDIFRIAYLSHDDLTDEKLEAIIKTQSIKDPVSQFRKVERYLKQMDAFKENTGFDNKELTCVKIADAIKLILKSLPQEELKLILPKTELGKLCLFEHSVGLIKKEGLSFTKKQRKIKP